MSNKTKIFFIIGALTVIFSSCTVNKPEEKVRTITVSGTGQVSLPADQLTVKFLVKTTEWNVNLSREKNAETTTKVIEKIKETGVSADDISTADYSIYQDNSNTYPGKYTVTNYISVLIRNTDKAGDVIDAAVANGANGLTSFRFSASDNPTAVREARTLAVQNAQDAASLIAGASGCKIAEVLDISEGYNSSSVTRTVNSALKSTVMMDSYTTPIEQGSVTVSSTVTMTFSLTN